MRNCFLPSTLNFFNASAIGYLPLSLMDFYFFSMNTKYQIKFIHSLPCSWYILFLSLKMLVMKTLKTKQNSQAPVAHTCNPRYSGGRDQEDQGSKPAQQIVNETLSWKKLITKKGWWSGSRCRTWVHTLVLQKNPKNKKTLRVRKPNQFIPLSNLTTNLLLMPQK
jgi:hypothetical protein